MLMHVFDAVDSHTPSQYCFTQDGYNALCIATLKRHEDIVNLLLAAKSDPELKEKV